MNPDLSLKEIKKEWHGTYKSYFIGFILSLCLTCLSFLFVIAGWFSVTTIIYSIVALALVQAGIQLYYFLHLGQEASPKWESITFYFMLLILLIIALGSLWIMHDLDLRVMGNMNYD